MSSRQRERERGGEGERDGGRGERERTQPVLNANVHRLLLCRQSLDIDRNQLALIPNYCYRNRVPEFLDKLEHALSFYLHS